MDYMNHLDDNTIGGKILFLVSMLGFAVTFSGVEIFLKIVALIGGIVCSIFTARYYHKKTKEIELKSRHHERDN